MDFHLSTRLLIERFRPEVQVAGQDVDIDVAVFFPKTPLVCHSDESKDSLSAAKCVDIMQRAIQAKSCATIEHLAFSLHTALKKELPMTLEIMVKVRMLDISPSLSFTFFPKKEEEIKKTSRNWDEE